VLAVKPQQMREVCAACAASDTQTVLSIAAGLRAGDLSRWLGGHARIVRAMPNTPALIGQGVTGLYADASVSDGERARAEQVLAAVGTTVWVATKG
jgi:pyrroline-5-carboxylate reductase